MSTEHRGISPIKKEEGSMEDIISSSMFQKVRKTLAPTFGSPGAYSYLPNMWPKTSVLLYGVEEEEERRLMIQALQGDLFGKTAKVVTFLVVHSGKIRSGSYDVAARNLDSLYNYARCMAPTIVYIEKAEDLVAAAGTDFADISWAFRDKLDGVRSKVARDVSFVLSTGFPSRFPAELVKCLEPIRAWLPTEKPETRIAILKEVWGDREVSFTEEQWEEAARVTRGWSAGSIRDLAAKTAELATSDAQGCDVLVQDVNEEEEVEQKPSFNEREAKACQ